MLTKGNKNPNHHHIARKKKGKKKKNSHVRAIIHIYTQDTFTYTMLRWKNKGEDIKLFSRFVKIYVCVCVEGKRTQNVFTTLNLCQSIEVHHHIFTLKKYQ